MCFLAVFLYGVGTRQQFTEPTQVLLLKIIGFTGIVLAFCALYGIILNIGFFFRGGGFLRVSYLWLYIAAVILGLVAASAAFFIIALTGGNSS
ncbi:hypothetical protein AGMMS49991_00850 [Spirochaetia bacterium]|nr:hypothetical protein AGMMS49991_00850 [Spirochaetia bacterium]